jgi:hypothetical protein
MARAVPTAAHGHSAGREQRHTLRAEGAEKRDTSRTMASSPAPENAR